jgi:8-oxo-dGTP pyrophosphatase MutT (NUDIX family)
VELRRAASVLVGRDGRDGLELLVMERTTTHRFLPGYVAFPGGAVDVEDAEIAGRWFGSAAESSRACAVRELVEECSLAVTGEGVRESVSLDVVEAAPPTVAQLADIAHWVAPEDVPVRFDARYYAVAAPPGLEPKPDGNEAALAWWERVPVLLEDWEAERRKLYWPTYFTLRALERCTTTDNLLAARIDTREPDDDELEFLHRSTFWQD